MVRAVVVTGTVVEDMPRNQEIGIGILEGTGLFCSPLTYVVSTFHYWVTAQPYRSLEVLQPALQVPRGAANQLIFHK